MYYTFITREDAESFSAGVVSLFQVPAEIVAPFFFAKHSPTVAVDDDGARPYSEYDDLARRFSGQRRAIGEN